MTYDHDDSVRAMMALATAITDAYTSPVPLPPMADSAQVCLEDAEACYDREDYQHATERATYGLAYLRRPQR